jgi:hypothetical protein
MRVLLIILLSLFIAPVARGQALSAELTTHLPPIPGNVNIHGPWDAIYPTSTVPVIVPPVMSTGPMSLRFGPMTQISAQTGVGATSITVQAQSLNLVPVVPQQTLCPHGRPCQILFASNPMGSPYQLESFTVDLLSPVPDPEGGCVNVSGTYAGQMTANSNPGSGGDFMALPQTPYVQHPIPPEGSPPPLPERYQLFGPSAARFASPGLLTFRVCGELPEARTGQLAYQITQAGLEWSWEAAGRWQISIQDNGYHGSGHYAVARHVERNNTHTGLLLSMAEGDVGQLHMEVERVNDPNEESLYEFDPENNPPPRAIAYRLSFQPGPGLAESYTLYFDEPAGLAHDTGRVNRQEVNNPAALSLSYLFREYHAGGTVVELPVTPYGPEQHVPLAQGASGQPGTVELAFGWELPEE